jgi:hypothetical protein
VLLACALRVSVSAERRRRSGDCRLTGPFSCRPKAAALELLDAARSKAEVLIIKATMYLTLRLRRWMKRVRSSRRPAHDIET